MDERGPFQQDLARDPARRSSLPAFHNDNIIDPDLAPFLSDDESDEEDAFEEARRIGGWPYFAALARRYSRITGRAALCALKAAVPRPRASTVPRSNRTQMFFGDRDVQTKRFRAPKGKKIYVPVRVEPKVYFAGERTFLGWVSNASLLSSLSHLQ